MSHTRPILLAVLSFVLVFTTACAALAPLQAVPPEAAAIASPAPVSSAGAPAGAPADDPPGSGAPSPASSPASAASTPAPAILLFGIGMHIEPLGATVSSLAGGTAHQLSDQPAANRSKPGYNQPQAFQRGVQDIQAVARIVERHGGKLTIQAQTPFTRAAIDNGSDVLSSLAQNGHEIALHFHEDAHLGKNPERLPVETWCAVMKEEIALIQQASGVQQVRYWSGGNLYPDLFQAAACAGLEVNSDWKNPRTQSTPLEMTGVQPWRPAGGTDGEDISAFIQHDPQSAVIYLPEGQYARGDFASMRRSATTGGEQAYFDFLEQSLLASLAAAQPGQVNVFHFTVHPGEFRGDDTGSGAQPFAVIERFLFEVVDPLVASDQVRWATFSEMAAAYAASEQASTGAIPGQTPAVSASPSHVSSRPYITFAINVHDWVHYDESADILLRLVDLFERYGVCGDFYFTAPVVEKYVQERPELIERLKHSNMTISYHIRPPHPLYPGFGQRLGGLSDAELEQTLVDYETYALDLSTGDLDRSRSGGYTYVAQVFGQKPVVASTNASDPRLKAAAQRVYASLGARMTVLYHEEGTDVQQPLVESHGLLVRPSDFSVTRVTSINGSDDFWWNYMSAPEAQRYDPLVILENGLAQWQQQGNTRQPFITALIHENNFYRSGPEAWSSFYYTMQKNKRAEPLSPPFDLSAPDPSSLRSPADQQAIWQAYERLVAHAASHLQVVTSEDILLLAGNERHPAIMGLTGH